VGMPSGASRPGRPTQGLPEKSLSGKSAPTNFSPSGTTPAQLNSAGAIRCLSTITGSLVPLGVVTTTGTGPVVSSSGTWTLIWLGLMKKV